MLLSKGMTHIRAYGTNLNLTFVNEKFRVMGFSKNTSSGMLV